MKRVLLDTDIGCDCDDAGAMAVLHRLADEGRCELLAVTHCTSRLSGVQCIDAIDRFYGRGDIPVGLWGGGPFLDGEPYEKFAREVGRRFPNRFAGPDAQTPPDAVELLLRTLREADDNSVTLAAIGPPGNLAALLRAPEGPALARHKLAQTVVMAGSFTEPREVEWNVAQDVSAAREVSLGWPSPMVYVPFEAGSAIRTGARLLQRAGEGNPVRLCYERFCGGPRESWDLLAVYAAVCGAEPFFTLSAKGTVRFDERGVSTWEEQGSRDRVLSLQPGREAELTERLEQLMSR